ncbi:MAG: hypothetical protein AAF788_06900 [Pseudomonadota bacterium]
MLSLLRALLVGALMSLAVPGVVVLATMSGALGPTYRLVDVLPVVAPLVAAVLLLGGVLAFILTKIFRLRRGLSDAVGGALVTAGGTAWISAQGVFADFGMGPGAAALIAVLMGVLGATIAFIRWRLSGRPRSEH